MSRRRELVLSALAIGLAALQAVAAKQWETDFQKAETMAKDSHRYMLLDFSGSDWCGWCMKLEEEVFSKKEFKKYAGENLVCVLVDFPRMTPLKKNLKEQNDALAKKFGISGYPSVIILSPDGEKVARTGYQAGGAENYVEHLKGLIDPHRTQNKVPPPEVVPVGAGKQPARLSGQKGIPAKLMRDENHEMRTWKTKNGNTIKASLLEEKTPYMILKKEDGAEVQVLKYNLSEEDLKYVAEVKAVGAANPAGSSDKL